MAFSSLKARLRRLTDDTILATTSNVIDFAIQWDLDKAGQLSVTVGLADAGDASGGGTSFSSALLAAAGTDAGGAPVPTLLELSLDGGTSYDARKLVEKPQRVLRAQQPGVQESGDDSWVTYSTLGVNRVTYTATPLLSALVSPKGTIPAPTDPSQTYLGIGNIPWLQGLFAVPAGGDNAPWGTQPGMPAWPNSARQRLTYTASVTNATIGGIVRALQRIPVNIDIWSDYVSKALLTICQRLGGVVFAGDTAPQGARGHFVADSSDIPLNLAFTLGLVNSSGGNPALGLVTPTGPFGHQGSSGATGRLDSYVVVGNVGGTPNPGFAFNGDTSARVVDETVEARITLDQATIQPDLTTLYGQTDFVGGASNSGFPPNGKVTGMTVINGTPSDSPPIAWTDCLPVVSIATQQQLAGQQTGDNSGGLYFWIGDGQMRRWPSTLAAPHLCLGVSVDGTTLYVGTNAGVYSNSSNPRNTSTPWTPVGGLSGIVTRIQTVPDGSGGQVLFALVQGTGKDGLDGIYRFPALAGSLTGAGYDGWSPLVQQGNILDFVATDSGTIWCILKAANSSAGNNQVLQYTFAPAPSVTTYTLPSNVKATKIDRVITAGTGTSPAQDSIWVATNGDGQGAYFAVKNADGTWGPFVGANQDGSLKGPADQPLQVNHVVGLGLTIGTLYTTVFACTNNGIFYQGAANTTPGFVLSGGGWKSANGLNGLDNVPITHVSAGAAQTLLTQTVNRIFASNDNQIFATNTGGLWWRDLTRDSVNLGPYLSNLALLNAYGDLPDNRIQTWGPSAHSPLGLADNTHIQIAAARGDTLPAGWYWQRRLDERLDWCYRLVNGNAPLSSIMFSQLSSIQTNEVVPLLVASGQLAYVSVRWLGEHSVAQTLLHLPSSFTTAAAALRTLRPSMQVGVTLVGTILARSSTGAIIGTQYCDFNNAPLYVLSHRIQKRAGSNVFETLTVLGPLLRTQDVTPQDMAASLADNIKSLKLFGPSRRP